MTVLFFRFAAPQAASTTDDAIKRGRLLLQRATIRFRRAAGTSRMVAPSNVKPAQHRAQLARREFRNRRIAEGRWSRSRTALCAVRPAVIAAQRTSAAVNLDTADGPYVLRVICEPAGISVCAGSLRTSARQLEIGRRMVAAADATRFVDRSSQEPGFVQAHCATALTVSSVSMTAGTGALRAARRSGAGSKR